MSKIHLKPVPNTFLDELNRKQLKLEACVDANVRYIDHQQKELGRSLNVC